MILPGVTLSMSGGFLLSMHELLDPLEQRLSARAEHLHKAVIRRAAVSGPGPLPRCTPFLALVYHIPLLTL